MRVFYDGRVSAYVVDVGGHVHSFPAIEDIKRCYPVEFAAAYPGGLDVGQGGNVSHRISTQGPEPR
jgi:hypothetical protein